MLDAVPTTDTGTKYDYMMKCHHPIHLDTLVFISFKHDYVYVSVPKTLSRTLVQTLMHMELAGTDYRMATNYPHGSTESSTSVFLDKQTYQVSRDNFSHALLNHHPLHSPFVRPYQMRPGAWADETRLKKFTFVRNPYTRVLSAYLDKVRRHEPQKWQILNTLQGTNYDYWSTDGQPAPQEIDFNQVITFEDFVTALEKIPPLEMDMHWKPQIYLTMLEAVSYDFVGHFETIDDDFKKLDEMLGGKFLPNYTVEDRNKTNAGAKLERYYTHELAERVCNIYRNDFDAFGYDHRLPI